MVSRAPGFANSFVDRGDNGALVEIVARFAAAFGWGCSGCRCAASFLRLCAAFTRMRARCSRCFWLTGRLALGLGMGWMVIDCLSHWMVRVRARPPPARA